VRSRQCPSRGDRMTLDSLKDDLESAIGHYVTAVAVKLLDEGLPVASIHA